MGGETLVGYWWIDLCINNPPQKKGGGCMKLNEMKLQKKSRVIKVIRLDANLCGSLFGMFR